MICTPDKETIFPLAITWEATKYTTSKFGDVSEGCPLMFIVEEETTCLDIFPSFPLNDFIVVQYNVVLSKEKLVRYQLISINSDACIELERNTREQSKAMKWHAFRMNRITASVCGDIVTRKKGVTFYMYSLSVTFTLNS